MRRLTLGTRVMLTVPLAGAVLLVWTGTSFAVPPTLGADCGAGASIVGSDAAGKVTLGQAAGTVCTLTFSAPWVNAPACTATNETNAGGSPVVVGVRTTGTTAAMGGLNPWVNGDVISYLCVGY